MTTDLCLDRTGIVNVADLSPALAVSRVRAYLVREFLVPLQLELLTRRHLRALKKHYTVSTTDDGWVCSFRTIPQEVTMPDPAPQMDQHTRQVASELQTRADALSKQADELLDSLRSTHARQLDAIRLLKQQAATLAKHAVVVMNSLRVEVSNG
jgi:hypothetical protein